MCVCVCPLERIAERLFCVQVLGDEKTVMNFMLESDLERQLLLNDEKSLQAVIKGGREDDPTVKDATGTNTYCFELGWARDVPHISVSFCSFWRKYCDGWMAMILHNDRTEIGRAHV